MGIFKELDSIIQDHCLCGSHFGEDNEVDDVKHDLLKDEIELHIQGKKKFLNLTKEAQEIMEEWERYERELRGLK